LVSESIEFGGYFTFFWLFLFNGRFRAARIREWREGSWLERTFILFEAVLSTLVGVVVPALLLWILLT
jgi:hypothetical protein